jgi:hypothetical protein
VQPRPESGVDDLVAELVGGVEVPDRVQVPSRPGGVEAVNVQVAPNAVWTLGPGKTLTGEAQIRRFFRLEAPQFQPENRWLPDTNPYTVRITVNGDRGTLYFQCHFIDVKTHEVVKIADGDFEVARISGRWLITSVVGGSPTLSL